MFLEWDRLWDKKNSDNALFVVDLEMQWDEWNIVFERIYTGAERYVGNGGAVGLVVVASGAELLVPFTKDLKIFALYMKGLESEYENKEVIKRYDLRQVLDGLEYEDLILVSDFEWQSNVWKASLLPRENVYCLVVSTFVSRDIEKNLCDYDYGVFEAQDVWSRNVEWKKDWVLWVFLGLLVLFL